MSFAYKEIWTAIFVMTTNVRKYLLFNLENRQHRIPNIS